MRRLSRRSFVFLTPAASLGALAVVSNAHAQDAQTEGRPPDIVVFSEETLRPALQGVARLWHARRRGPVHVFVAPSNLLVEQLTRGARCDLLIVAGEDKAAIADQRGLLRPDSRIAAWRNRLVIATNRPMPSSVAIKSGPDLVALLAGEPLGIPDAGTSQSGLDVRAALETLGAWSLLTGRTVGVENTGTVAELLAQKKIPFGAVYATDVAADRRLSVAATIPDELYTRPLYVAARTMTYKSPQTANFQSFLREPDTSRALGSAGLEIIG